MRAKLPFIGQVATGKDANIEVTEKVVEKLVQSEMGAAFLNLSNNSLTDYKTISDRLLQSFNGWTYANVSVLAEEISKMEFELYKSVMKGGVMELEKIDTHPLLDLLDRFNPFTTTSQAMYLTEVYLELAGDTFYVIDGSGANIKNLFILQPDKVEVVPGDVDDEYMIAKYIYKDTVDGKQKEVEYEPDQIIQIKTPNPINPYRGKSVVEASAMDIDTDNLAQEMIKMFFKNGATPSVVLTSEQRITKDDIHRLQVDLKRTYGGVKNAFKSMILGNGLKPVTLQQTAREMQFLEIEHAMRDKIMAMFKNTPASLGIVEDVNRANAEASLLSWKTSVILPKMQRIVDTLNEFLVPRYGDNLILTFCNPVPEDVSSKIVDATALIETGVVTVNEAREMINLDPVKGGDEITGVGEVAQEPEKIMIPDNVKLVDYRKHFRQVGIYKSFEDYVDVYRKAYKIAEKQTESKAIVETEDTKLLDYYHKQIHIVDVYEKLFADQVESFITNIQDKAIANLSKFVSKKAKALDVFDYDRELQAGIDLFTPLQEEIAKLSASEANTLLNISSVYVVSESLDKSIAKNVERFTKSMLDTDREKLTELISSGVNNGDSIAQMTNTIQEDFSKFKKTQTQRVVRTEVLRASNEAAVDAWKQSGVVKAKQWLTAGDPCPYCAPMNGKITGLDKTWFKKGSTFLGDSETPITFDYMSIKHPPLHVNCRCTEVPVLKDIRELASDSDEIKELKEYTSELEEMLGIKE